MLPVTPTFDTISAWWACQPPTERAASLYILDAQRMMLGAVEADDFESIFTSSGFPVDGVRFQTYIAVHLLQEGFIPVPPDEMVRVYFYNEILWTQRLSWFETPGVNKNTCVQRLYPDSPIGFTKYPPP